MIYAGEVTRRMIESAALAHAIQDPEKLAVLLRAVFQGVPLRQFAPHAQREEADALVAAMTSRVMGDMDAWRRRHGAPVEEVVAAVARLDEALDHLAEPVRAEAGPDEDGEALALALCVATAKADPALAQDVITRDIALALARAAYNAARGYARALATLRLELDPPS